MPWVQAVPLSDLPVWKVIQKCEGLAFLRGESALGTHRAKRCKVSLRTHMSSSATDQDYLRRVRRKACDAVSRPRGAGLGSAELVDLCTE